MIAPDFEWSGERATGPVVSLQPTQETLCSRYPSQCSSILRFVWTFLGASSALTQELVGDAHTGHDAPFLDAARKKVDAQASCSH
jgi:hypothetical protein